MAEKRHGVALVPSAVPINRYTLHAARVTHRGESLREPLAIFWDPRRTLPRFATAYCEQLAVYVRRVFPIARPSEPAVEEAAPRAPRQMPPGSTSAVNAAGPPPLDGSKAG